MERYPLDGAGVLSATYPGWCIPVLSRRAFGWEVRAFYAASGILAALQHSEHQSASLAASGYALACASMGGVSMRGAISMDGTNDVADVLLRCGLCGGHCYVSALLPRFTPCPCGCTIRRYECPAAIRWIAWMMLRIAYLRVSWILGRLYVHVSL